MDHKKYEQYVEEVIRNLNIVKSSKVYRNRKYLWIRQPGTYEIDISCEVFIDKALAFLIIVECKYWKKPFGREVVQKMIQTRDAISAQKAAIVSPVGFTKEAEEVAKANGIALWIVAKGIFEVVMGGGLAAYTVTNLITNNLLRDVGEILECSEYYRIEPAIVPFYWVEKSLDKSYGNIYTYHYYDRFDRINPFLRILIFYFNDNTDIRNSITEKIAQRLLLYFSILKNSGMNDLLNKEYFDNIIIGGAIKNARINFDILEEFDKNLPHNSVKLIPTLEWVKKNKSFLFIYPDNDNHSLRIENNVIWANISWLLDSKDMLYNAY